MITEELLSERGKELEEAKQDRESFAIKHLELKPETVCV